MTLRFDDLRLENLRTVDFDAGLDDADLDGVDLDDVCECVCDVLDDVWGVWRDLDGIGTRA